MKKLISALLFILCCQMTFAEKAIIDHIVYELDLNKLTAKVLNFQTSTEDVCDVCIPSNVMYKHDIYQVTALGYDKLEHGYEFYYQYDKARINIEHLYLPNSLEEISTDAFTGMARLQELIIPRFVKLLVAMRRDGWLNSWNDCPILGRDNKEEFPRMRSITILGTPTCKREERGDFRYYTISKCYYYDRDDKKVEIPLDMASYDYKLKVAYTIAGIKSLDNPTSKLCPNLNTFSMPAVERELAQIKQCYSEVQRLANSYNTKLKEHPYFDGSQITFKLDYKDSQTQLRKDCDSIKKAMTKQFVALKNGQMESNLRNNNLSKYLEIYFTQHPELKPSIDSVRFEYRCEDSPKQDSLVLLFIEHNVLPLSCRERQYQQYQNLFADRAEFNEIYDRKNADSFQTELDYRIELRLWLDRFIGLVRSEPDTKLQGMTSAKEGSIPYRIYAYLKKFTVDYNTQDKRNYFFDVAVDTIFENNEKIKAEYAKNGHFFNSRQEFFEAYITPVYKKILKSKQNR